MNGNHGFHFDLLLLLSYFQAASSVENTGNLRFKSIPSSFAATFFMMLDNLQYDNILLNYKGSAGNGLVLYILYIAYCFMMPIIFLNLLVSDLQLLLELFSKYILSEAW